MPRRPLRVLILEDRPEDAELELHELRRAGFEPAWRRVDDEVGFRSNLDPELDLISPTISSQRSTPSAR